MTRRAWLLAAISTFALFGAPPVAAQPTPPVGEMKTLGDDRYQIGRVVVDKRARKFTIPGRVHATNVPLEYLATSPGGMKAYETMLEVDASGSEFNLACLLIGLERDANLPQYQQFSRVALVGPRVSISVAWTDDGKRRQMSAAEALLNPEAGVQPESVEWVYTGAPNSRPGTPFAADVTGTLIGFVHDANSIIESAVGIGIGAYGTVRGSASLPPQGSAIELIVELSRAAK